MENQPNREHQNQPKIFITIGGEKRELTPETAQAYLHEDQPQFDHIFIVTSREDEVSRGFFVFRQHLSNFDAIVQAMRYIDCETVESDTADLRDQKAYFDLFGYPEAPELDLTPHQDKHAKFLLYLLEKEHLMADEFAGSGDLYI